MKFRSTLPLFLLPLAGQAQSRAAFEAIALVKTGAAVLPLLLAGVALLLVLRVPEARLADSTTRRLGYVLTVALLGPVVAATLGILVFIALVLFAGLRWPEEASMWLAAGLAFLGVLRLGYTHRLLACRSLLVGSGFGLFVAAMLLRGPSILAPETDPLGLVQSDIRDAPLPRAAPLSTPLLFESDGYDLLPTDARPGFPGGNAGLRSFVQGRLRYPLLADLLGREGIVHVLFTVQATGHIANLETIGTVDWGCAREARRVVEALPGFAPARRNGKPLAAKIYLTFAFSSN